MNDTSHQVIRTVKLNSASVLQPASATVRGIEGVVSVEAAGQQQLNITYDFTRLTWGMVCETLKTSGYYTPKSRLARWRDGWRDQFDHNMRDNLAHRAACCSKPPPGAGRK